MRTVSNRLLRDWLQVTKAKGHDIKLLLTGSGIPWRCYEDTRAYISGEQLARLNAQTRQLLDDQFLGFGNGVIPPALLDRVMIKILAQAGTLQEVLREWEQFWNLVQGATGLTSTCIHRNEFVYRYRFTRPQRPGTYVWILDSTMLKLQLFGWMIGREIRPNVIGIAEPAPAGVGEDLALLPARVLFDQPQNFFTFDQGYLCCPVVRTAEECLDYKRYLPVDFFALAHEERCFARSVERTLKDLLKTEFRLPPIECVAEELSISVRGLRRKLQSEGDSFQGLKDRVRRAVAEKKLARADLAIGDIAADLGFSGTAAFSRAFKLWTTSTPQEYRARHAAAYRHT